MKQSRAACAAFLLCVPIGLLVVLLGGCGGGGGSLPERNRVNYVEITPSQASVKINSKLQLTAVVHGDQSAGVRWSMLEPPLAIECCGPSISQDGTFYSSFFAGTYHIQASTPYDTATATVVVLEIPPTFTTTPLTSAAIGVPYSYLAQVKLPGEVFGFPSQRLTGPVTFSLTQAPAGAYLNESTVYWIPTQETAGAPQQFELTAKYATGTAKQSWSVTASSAFQPAFYNIYIDESGNRKRVASSVGSDQLKAFEQTPAGDFRNLPFTVAADGTITVSGRTAPAYYLALGKQRFFQSTAAAMNLNFEVPGRPDTTPPPFTGTTGLSLPSCVLCSLWAPNNGLSGRHYAPVYGDTFKFSWDIPAPYFEGWHPLYTPLVEGLKGDVLYVDRFVDATAKSIESTFSSSPEMTPLSITALNADWKNPPLETAEITLATQAFTDVVKTSSYEGLTVFYPEISVQPTHDRAGQYFFPSAPASYKVQPAPESVPDGTTLKFDYGNPYGPRRHFITFTWKGRVSYELYGTYPGSTYPELSVSLPLVSPMKLAPLVGNVLDAAIDGEPLLGPVGQAGSLSETTPKLTWTAPTVGQATGYRVEIGKLEPYYVGSITGTTTISDLVAYLYTTDTSVTVPPGLLQPGGNYIFVIRSVHDAGVDFNTNPYGVGLERGYAEVCGAPVSVSATAKVTPAP